VAAGSTSIARRSHPPARFSRISIPERLLYGILGFVIVLVVW